jgi:hypothetical protein
VIVGLTVIEEEVELLLHEYVFPPDAVMVAIPPAQITAEVAVGVIGEAIVTEVVAVSLHPFALVTTTE